MICVCTALSVCECGFQSVRGTASITLKWPRKHTRPNRSPMDARVLPHHGLQAKVSSPSLSFSRYLFMYRSFLHLSLFLPHSLSAPFSLSATFSLSAFLSICPFLSFCPFLSSSISLFLPLSLFMTLSLVTRSFIALSSLSHSSVASCWLVVGAFYFLCLFGT